MKIELSDFFHQIPVQVRFNDVDGLGHLNNTSIQEYFDLGRVFYLRDALGKDLGKEGRHLVIVANKTDFFGEILPDEKIKVYTRVYQLGNKSLKMIQWVVKDGDTVPRASCDSVMVGFLKPSNNAGTGMVIPDEWRERFNLLEKGRLTQGTDR